MSGDNRIKVDAYMPLYVSDYDRDTADLSFEEHGFYMAILRALWTRGGELDGSDRQRLARVLRTDLATFDRLWPAVERFFTVDLSGKFQQKRLTRELNRAIESAKRIREAASAAGKASAAARKGSTPVQRPFNARSTDEATYVRTGVQLSQISDLTSDLILNSVGGEALQDPDRAKEPARPPSKAWTAWQWRQAFGRAWRSKYGRTYGEAGDAAAIPKLADALDGIPEPERLDAQANAERMFSEFLATEQPKTVQRRHPFAFFVQEWGGLRVPRQPAAEAPSRFEPIAVRIERERSDRALDARLEQLGPQIKPRNPREQVAELLAQDKARGAT